MSDETQQDRIEKLMIMVDRICQYEFRRREAAESEREEAQDQIKIPVWNPERLDLSDNPAARRMTADYKARTQLMAGFKGHEDLNQSASKARADAREPEDWAVQRQDPPPKRPAY